MASIVRCKICGNMYQRGTSVGWDHPESCEECFEKGYVGQSSRLGYEPHQPMASECNDDFLRFNDLKNRFHLLETELHNIREEWKKLHDGSSVQHFRTRHQELLEREMKILDELREVLRSIHEVMQRNLKRTR